MPKRIGPLGKWVSTQRYKKKKGELSAEQIKTVLAVCVVLPHCDCVQCEDARVTWDNSANQSCSDIQKQENEQKWNAMFGELEKCDSRAAL